MATLTLERTGFAPAPGAADFPRQRTEGETLTFGAIVDVIYALPLEERLDLRNLLDRNIVEARRIEMRENGEEARRAEKNNGLFFSDDIATLRKML